MLKIFPESLDPQQPLHRGFRFLAGKIDHEFSLGLAPIT